MKRGQQLSLRYGGSRRGGARKNAGRPPGRRGRTPHRRRPEHSRHHPLHVVLRARGVPSLRAQVLYGVVRAAFVAGKDRFGFRLLHYSVQPDHIHLVVEAEDARALTRAMKGLGVRIARQLNGRIGRRGRVFDGRYFARPLKTPREVRNCLRYVLLNFFRHKNVPLRGFAEQYGIDALTSAAYFDGWAASTRAPLRPGPDDPVMPARTWLIREGWKRHYGPINPYARV